MKTIYLASNSKARRELLKSLGLKFKILPSKVKEKRSAKGISYAGLVKVNARNKAKDIAAKVEEGIIIAADTIMVQDGKIFGKPKDLKAAEHMLKEIVQLKVQLLPRGAMPYAKDQYD